MRIYLAALFIASLSLSSFAQNNLYSIETIEQMKRLQEASLQSDYAYKIVDHLANNIGPRLSGSPQAQKAVEYVSAQMKKIGSSVYLQNVMVPHWVRGEETGAITLFKGMAAGTTQKIVLTALGGSIATPEEGVEADVVVVRSFEELDKLPKKSVDGKIVLFNSVFNTKMQDAGYSGHAYGQAVQYRFNGAIAAAKQGAILVLVRSAGGSQNRLAHTGVMGYEDGVKKIPSAAVSFEDAETIARLAEDGKVRVRVILTPKSYPKKLSHNVIAEIIGSEKPNEVVLIGGHLDSWDLGTGALDNACGVAASMQVLYLMKKLGIKPKRTVRFVAFMNEENGGAGNTTYFEANKNSLDKHFASIESDMGDSRAFGIEFSGNEKALPLLAPIAKILKAQGAQIIQYKLGSVGVDTAKLTKAGVPGFAPLHDSRRYFKYHHTAADTFDKVEKADLTNNSALMAVLALGLANLEQPLPRNGG